MLKFELKFLAVLVEGQLVAGYYLFFTLTIFNNTTKLLMALVYCWLTLYTADETKIMSKITSYETSLSLQSGIDSAFKWTQEWLRKLNMKNVYWFIMVLTSKFFILFKSFNNQFHLNSNSNFFKIVF